MNQEKMTVMRRKLSLIGVLLMMTGSVTQSHLVSDNTIKIQKNLTHNFTLDNGLKVAYREIPGSDIIEFDYSFGWGRAYQAHAEKSLPSMLFATMPKAAEGWDKHKIFTTLERYSAKLQCSSGVEISNCSMTTINDYWLELLPMFAAVVKQPVLHDEDIHLALDGEVATVQEYIQDPESYVNDVVNRVFYPKDHPYKLSAEDNLTQLTAVTRSALVKLHQQILAQAEQQIVVVASLPLEQLKKDLNKYFGKLPLQGVRQQKPEPTVPAFNRSEAFAIEDKPIPNAYIAIKTTLPGTQTGNEPAIRLLFSILSEELWEEVRTKHSLSYSVFAQPIMHRVGIAAISASTSKPKETLEAITRVVDRLKRVPYSDEQLAQFKTKFVTQYFLTLESHDSLSNALVRSLKYWGSTDVLYDIPRSIDKIKPADITELAQKYLVNFRIGVVYAKDKFDPKWAEEMTARSL